MQPVRVGAIPVRPAVIVGLIWLLGLSLVLGNNPVSDEVQHLGQAVGFADGDFELDDTITMLPGYHVVIAVPLAATGSESADVARVAGVVIGLAGIAGVHLATRRRGRRSWAEIASNERALQWALLPVAAPYAFLVYTDQLAALTVLAIWILLRHDRTEWAGIAALVAVCVRQTNIVWAAILCLVDLAVRTGSLREAVAAAVRPATLRRYWTFAIPIGIVVAILATQGTVAIGDTDIHRVGFYPENALFMVMVCGGLFWPLLLNSAAPPAERGRLWVASAVVAGAVYLLAWDPDHVFNQFGGTKFVRNWLLINSTDRAPVRVLLLVALMFGMFVLARIELAESIPYWFFALSALALIPQQLVEQRYYMVPILFLLIFRKPSTVRAERLLLAWWAVVTVAIMVAMFGLERIVI